MFSKFDEMFRIKKSILKDSHFRKLYETDKYIAGHQFEYAYLIEKRANKEVYLGASYGDPTCALISTNNDWCLIGGCESYLWRAKEKEIITFNSEEIQWVRQIKQTDDYKAQLLIDPWSNFGAIWELDIKSLKTKKLKAFDMRNEPNTENIVW